MQGRTIYPVCQVAYPASRFLLPASRSTHGRSLFGCSTLLARRLLRQPQILQSGLLRKETEAQTSLGRIGQPQDIAPAAVFLASADSALITGETFAISGGLR